MSKISHCKEILSDSSTIVASAFTNFIQRFSLWLTWLINFTHKFNSMLTSEHRSWPLQISFSTCFSVVNPSILLSTFAKCQRNVLHIRIKIFTRQHIKYPKIVDMYPASSNVIYNNHISKITSLDTCQSKKHLQNILLVLPLSQQYNTIPHMPWLVAMFVMRKKIWEILFYIFFFFIFFFISTSKVDNTKW